MDAVIYNRVWGVAAPEERISTRDQERENRAWCKANGHNVIKVFTDESISASRFRFRKKTRDAWAELKDYLKPGHLLVCWEASPHSQDLAEFVKLSELCERRGVKLAYKGRVFDVPELVATFDAVGTGQAADGTSLSWTHTIGGAASAIVVAVDAFWFTVPTISAVPAISAEVGTTPMALLGSAQYRTGADTALVYLFGLLNPPTGAQTITVSVTTSQTEYLVGNSLSYNGVTSFGAAATNSGSSANPALVVSAATNEMVVQAFGGFTTPFAACHQTQRYNAPWANGVNLSFLMGDAPGAGTGSFTCSEANSPWGAIGVPLIPKVSGVSEAIYDWDGWLGRLVEDDTARKVADIRAYLITEVSRAISRSDARRAIDADRLAEIAVDTMIESTRKIQIPPS